MDQADEWSDKSINEDCKMGAEGEDKKNYNEDINIIHAKKRQAAARL